MSNGDNQAEQKKKQKTAMEEDVYSIIREGLMDLMKTPTSPKTTNLRVKLDYMGEKRSIDMSRPASFRALHGKLREMYGRSLSIYYTLSSCEVIVPIRSQTDLDKAVQLVDRSAHQRSLRLLLSRHEPDHLSPQPDTDDAGRYCQPTVAQLSPSRMVEVPYAPSSTSSRLSSRYGDLSRSRSAGGSSVSSGVLPDFAPLSERRSTQSPRAPANWRQGRCLGTGAFGQVFLCYDVDSGRELAVKRLHFARSDVQLRKQMMSLENEIALLSNVQHERIVQYLGVQRSEEHICVFMEYMGGGSVRDLIVQFGRLSGSVARKYTSQVLNGLAYLHRLEIVHRDIKTANILRDSEGNVKIADFGSGRRLQTICSQHGNSFVGTPQYMAPEVVQGTRRYGRKADIWSVGCCLGEMLAGEPPWHGLEPMAVIFQIALHTGPPPFRLAHDVDQQLVDVLPVMMTRDPDQRPTTADLLRLPLFQASGS